MNNKRRLLSLSAGLVAVLFGFFPAAIAFAESESGGVSVGNSLRTQIETGDHERSSVGATTSTDIDESDSGEMDSEHSHSRTTTTSAHREEDSQRNSNEQKDEESGDKDDELEVDHDSALQATTTIENSDEVHNNGELRSFLNHIVKEDDRISDVQVSSTTIDTQYSLPARFLWAIPTSISAQVSVGTDGTVTISYPWYAFLFARHDDELEARLTQAANTTVGANASTTISASSQAHLLNLIFSVLRGD